jgi:hypothetical protein
MAAALPWSRWHQVARLVLGSRRRGALALPPGLLASWQQRLQRVRSLLAREPRATMSWYWRTHERVLDYMLKRYATGAGSRPVVEDAAAEPQTMPGPPGPTLAQEAQARTLPAELVPAAKPLRTSPDPEVVKRARAHLSDIASANLAADKPPPPVFVRPPRLAERRCVDAARPRSKAQLSPWLDAGLIGGAVLLQAPIVAAGFVLGQPVLGIGIGLAIVCAAIVVAAEHGDRSAKNGHGSVESTQTRASPPVAPLCPRCGYDLRHIPPGSCPECGESSIPRSPAQARESAR